MKFSICIPNYNYAPFIGRTIESVLQQTYGDFEIVVSDNASTDESVEVVRNFADPRIKLTVNRCNVGFAGNLDRAARQATGDMLILLSSDDVMRPEALATYARLIETHRLPIDRLVLGSSCDLIDAEDRTTGVSWLPRHRLWREEDRAPEADASVDAEVYRTSAAELLRRSLRCLSNPFFFCTTAYSRKLYESVEGYGGGRFIGPDKWFHWRLLATAETAYFIRRPLFCYRWHANNQTAQQAQSGALKYLLDQYAATFELDAALLAQVQLSRTDLQRAFIEYDVVRPGLSMVADAKRVLARRTLNFGKAVYPNELRKNPKGWALRALLFAGPFGTWTARALRKHYDPYSERSNAVESD